MFTQQTQIRQCCFTTLSPRDDVMSVTISSRTVTTRKHTTLVPHLQSVADIGSDQALFATHVERSGGAAQNDRQDPGITRELPQLAWSEHGAVSQTGCVAVAKQILVVDQHHHMGTIATVFGYGLLDRDPASQLDESISTTLRPRRLRHTRIT